MPRNPASCWHENHLAFLLAYTITRYEYQLHLLSGARCMLFTSSSTSHVFKWFNVAIADMLYYGSRNNSLKPPIARLKPQRYLRLICHGQMHSNVMSTIAITTAVSVQTPAGIGCNMIKINGLHTYQIYAIQVFRTETLSCSRM